jgi:hypothetical protein
LPRRTPTPIDQKPPATSKKSCTRLPTVLYSCTHGQYVN